MLHWEHVLLPRGPTELPLTRFWPDRDGRRRSVDRDSLIEMFIVPEQSPMLLGGARDHVAVKGSA